MKKIFMTIVLLLLVVTSIPDLETSTEKDELPGLSDENGNQGA